MFNGEWIREFSDSAEQLCLVIGVNDNAMKEKMAEYQTSSLSTIIDEKENAINFNRRFLFSSGGVEEQKADITFGKIQQFPMADGTFVDGCFKRQSVDEISGYEGDLQVKYKIKDGKLIETVTQDNHTFKQVSYLKL